MPVRPSQGGSRNTWGTELNAWLDVFLKADGTPNTPLTITPASGVVSGLVIVPAASQSADLFSIPAGSMAIGSSSSLNLAHLSFHNTGGAGGNLYGLRIDANCDTVDTGAAVAIVNTGNADGIYINSKGSSGATTPTGIGLDMNRGSSATTENSATSAGYGLQIWDFSTTSIGGPGTGPTGIYLLKKNNPDTAQVMLYVRANRNAIRLTIPDTGSANYSATQPIIEVTDNAGAFLWRIQADGNQVFKNTLGSYFNMAAGAQGLIQGNSSNQLDLRGGTGGLRILDSTGGSARLSMTDAGAFTFNGVFSVQSDGQILLPNAKSLILSKTSAGVNSYVQMNSSDQIDILGGGGASGGVRILTNDGLTVNWRVNNAGNLFWRDGATVSLGTTTGVKIGNATTEKLGFYNKTPVVQPSTTGETVGFTAGGGTTVTDASTFTGNVGATAYRISDIVKHLKNLGLIAS